MGFIKFLFKSVDATIETKKTVKDISNNASYCNGLFTDDIVSPDAFLKMYNMRSYDFYSGQSDIKFMKTIDFPGAYIIHNNNTGIYYVGVASKVYRKLKRIFNGYEKENIFEEYSNGDKLTIHLIRLDKSENDNISGLYKDLKRKYCANKSYIFV